MLIEGALLWLTINVYHEARGEDALSQRAVAHVTLNRAKQHGYDVKKVVKEPYQFSWTLDKKNSVVNLGRLILMCSSGAV